VNVRPAMPGTPIMPRPATVIRCTSGMIVIALAVNGVASGSGRISVPGWAGLNVLRTRMGIPRSMTGRIVLGCTTLAPKNANSPTSR